MRRFFAFWWLCIRQAFWGNTAFANDWQWVFGIPAVSGVLAFVAASRGAADLTTGYPIADAFLVALGAFIVTWLVAFMVRLFNAPAVLYQQQSERTSTTEIETGRLRAKMSELEDKLRESDPIVQAFNEKRLERYRTGAPFNEEGLSWVIFWIAGRSAWSRWQQAFNLAKNGSQHDEAGMIHLASSSLQSAIEEGRIIVRGRRKGRDVMEPISADFFCNVAVVHFEPDPISLWRAHLIPKGGWVKGETPFVDDYSSLRTDFARIQELWPERDEKTDAATQSLLEEAAAKGRGTQ